MNKILINSQIQLGPILEKIQESDFKYEPMFYSCSYDFAFKKGGLATKHFLSNLPLDWQNENTIIDSRVHMLMENWYPCIPGYHHDDVPRERGDKQPDYHNPSYRSEHCMILYNGSVCATEFAIGESEFEDVPLNKVYYKIWHPEVLKKIESGELTKISIPENQLVFFNDRTWHQGVKATKTGWRLFIRASRNTNRKISNEIRQQVQVYLENPTEGW